MDFAKILVAAAFASQFFSMLPARLRMVLFGLIGALLAAGVFVFPRRDNAGGVGDA